MKTNIIYYIITILTILIITACFTIFSKEKDYIVNFLNDYGYDVTSRPVEIVRVEIPEPLDDVFENYNELQLKAGFDLHNYTGKCGTRYTYNVKNYADGTENVRANVLVIDGKIVGGDICTLNIDGFMHELRENKQ